MDSYSNLQCFITCLLGCRNSIQSVKSSAAASTKNLAFGTMLEAVILENMPALSKLKV